MKIKIIAVGKIKESFYTEAVNEYLKRLSRFCKTEIVEVEEYTSYKTEPNKDEIEKILSAEGKEILSKMEGICFCLDICGKQFSSEEFALKIDEIKQQSSTVTFVIGSSYGLADSVKAKCDFKISFGKNTYPHQLMRVILSEQIYRAFMISSGSAYHK